MSKASWATFLANWDGECTCCGDSFEQGDNIAYLDDELVCEYCWRAHKDD